MSIVKVPISLCLFTSTKGHFGIKIRYQETIQSLSANIPLSYFANKVAHIKVSPGEEAIAVEMTQKLEGYGFKVYSTTAIWSHGQNSHQIEYLSDMLKIYSLPELQKTKYVFALEDDWLLKSDNFIKDVDFTISLFEQNPDLLQVRIPRYSNEFDRINGLYTKHGIQGVAKKASDKHFWHNDFSMNPSLFRLRDLRNALVLLHRAPNLPMHVEHGLGAALKFLSMANTPFAALTTARIAHIGTPTGQEDDINKELMAT